MKTPHDVKELMTWSWEDFAPAYQELEKAPLSAANVEGWLDGGPPLPNWWTSITAAPT